MPKNKILFLLTFSFFALTSSTTVFAAECASPNSCETPARADCPGGRLTATGDCTGANTGKLCCAPSAPATSGLDYQLLEKIPGGPTSGSNLPAYVLAIYNLALAIVVLSAVFMVSIGGFMYLTSAGNTSSMHTAKEIIFDALIGLVIALVAWLLLNIINPDLTNVSINGLSPVPVVPTTATPPAPGSGGAPGTCGGYAVSGISSSQCADASPALTDLLACMYAKDPNTKVNSISDSVGFDRCKTSWQQGICAHAATSCHYGGGASKTAPDCQKSQAVDLSTRGTSVQEIINAAAACGGRWNNEGNHIHVSTQTSCCKL